MSAGARPRVVLLRGHHANVWDLRPWERLRDAYDVAVLVTGSNVHQVAGLDLEVVEVRTPRDALPGKRVAGAAAYALGERYRDLDRHLAGADIVHGAEIGTWFAAQAAELRGRMGFALALTVWETIAWRTTYRWPRERGYRRRVLAAGDRFLPATERARDALLLEGVAPERITLAPPGIDLDHFASAPAPVQPPAKHRILSAGRLVWEKGHQDVLRAFAALRRVLDGTGHIDVELLVVGDGPERKRLERYARELGIADSVEFRPTVPYEDMPALYASASALVLASLPTRGWEEQFGMVLVEALAAGTPVIACSTGAIPEVLGSHGTLVAAGDWLGIAQALGDAVAGAPAQRAEAERASLERYSAAAAAERLRAVYAELLAGTGRSPKRPVSASR
jgi:glycosyltransferase involved in cell wall biosynthesis